MPTYIPITLGCFEDGYFGRRLPATNPCSMGQGIGYFARPSYAYWTFGA